MVQPPYAVPVTLDGLPLYAVARILVRFNAGTYHRNDASLTTRTAFCLALLWFLVVLPPYYMAYGAAHWFHLVIRLLSRTNAARARGTFRSLVQFPRVPALPDRTHARSHCGCRGSRSWLLPPSGWTYAFQPRVACAGYGWQHAAAYAAGLDYLTGPHGGYFVLYFTLFNHTTATEQPGFPSSPHCVLPFNTFGCLTRGVLPFVPAAWFAVYRITWFTNRLNSSTATIPAVLWAAYGQACVPCRACRFRSP